MMISPEGFISEYEDKAYRELLSVRDKLIRKLRSFEKNKNDPGEVYIDPAPEVIYQCDLEYLAMLCKLIAEKYNQEFV